VTVVAQRLGPGGAVEGSPAWNAGTSGPKEITPTKPPHPWPRVRVATGAGAWLINVIACNRGLNALGYRRWPLRGPNGGAALKRRGRSGLKTPVSGCAWLRRLCRRHPCPGYPEAGPSKETARVTLDGGAP
jgi:hypothetical protein